MAVGKTWKHKPVVFHISKFWINIYILELECGPLKFEDELDSSTGTAGFFTYERFIL